MGIITWSIGFISENGFEGVDELLEELLCAIVAAEDGEQFYTPVFPLLLLHEGFGDDAQCLY